MKNQPLDVAIIMLIDGWIAYSYLRVDDWQGWIVFVMSIAIGIYLGDIIAKRNHWPDRGIAIFVTVLGLVVVIGYLLGWLFGTLK